MLARRRENIKRIVEKHLRLAGINEPPVDVEKVAKLKGATLRYVDDEGGTAGFLSRRNGIIIAVNSQHSEERRRLTIAHELGHLELGTGGEIHVDRILSFFLLSDSVTEPAEAEANLFALELLVPTAMLERDLAGKGYTLDFGDEELIRSLAHRYVVSPLLMSIRLAHFETKEPRAKTHFNLVPSIST